MAVLAVMPTYAQESRSPIIGVGAGYEVAGEQYSGAWISFLNTPGYGIFYRGTLTGVSTHAELTYPSLLSKDFGGSLRFELLQSNATFHQDLPDALVLLPGTQVPVQQLVEQRLTFSMHAFQLQLLGQYRLGELTLAAGPYIGYRRLYKVRNVQNLLLPANAHFVNPQAFPEENDGRTLIFDDGSQLQAQPVSLGGLLNVAYSIAVIDRIALVPEVRLRGDLLPPTGNAQWIAFSIGGGLSLTYTLPSEELPDQQMPALSPPPPSLNASVDLYSSGTDGSRMQKGIVRVGKLSRRQHLQLPPVIFFDRDSFALPARYVQLSSQERARFALDSIARLDPLDAYRHLLNVVGTRLRSDRTMKVRLVASASREEPAGIARARAEQIRSYLLNVWEVAGAQAEVAVKSQPWAADDAAQRSVRIVAVPEAEMTAVRGEWIERSFQPTPIGVEPGINVSGIRKWSITFFQNGKMVARQTSEDAGDDKLDLDMLLRDLDPDRPPAPLAVEVIVEDSTGAIASAHDELPFEFELPLNTLATGEQSYHSTYVLYGSLQEDDVTRQRLQLQEIASSVPDGARITVSSMSHDNAAAQHVMQTLRGLLASKGGVKLEAVENVQRRNSDATPEARLIDRGVRIVIEQHTNAGLQLRSN